MKTPTIQAMRNYLYKYSGFTPKTVNNVISSLGYSLQCSHSEFLELSSQLENCAEHGADGGFSGFIYYTETLAFFKANRQDIVTHMENAAAEMGTDIISMVQNFGVFRNTSKPTVGEVGKALWGSGQLPHLTSLYNVFAWYALEEIAHSWYRYLEDNPSVWAQLSA